MKVLSKTMNSDDKKPATATERHVVAIPFPGRGHVNPMMNVCKLLASRKQDLLITFVVTEEWLGFIGADPRPNNIRFATIPNVIPSERLKAADFPAFYESVMTKMEAPFDQLLDRLEQPISIIIADVELLWPIGLANRRNLPVASLWTMPASVFSVFYHFALLSQNRIVGDECMDNILEPSSTHEADFRTMYGKNDERVMQLAMKCTSRVAKSQYLLFTSVYELEAAVINTLRTEFSFPVYPIGPSIPYLELESNPNRGEYFRWLDGQPENSVLYVSLGSFLSVSMAQMDEIVAGLRDSRVRYLLVYRGDTLRFECGETGYVIPWCEQLRVLCHSSVGGFWTHCGWNSTLECVFAGKPMLTFPLFFDQFANSRAIVEEWRIGWRVKRDLESEELVKREEISGIVKRFMDLESIEGKEMRKRAKEIRQICEQAIENEGSSASHITDFMKEIS